MPPTSPTPVRAPSRAEPTPASGAQHTTVRAARWLVLVLATAVLLGACGTSNKPSLSAATANPKATVASTTTTAARPTTCTKLDDGQSLAAVAKYDGPLAIYANAGDATPTQTMDNPYLINGNAKAQVPLTFLVKDFPPTQDCQWVQIYLPIRPNGSTGWVKATDMNLATNPWRLDADLGAFTLKVFKDGQQVDTIKIGVAKTNTPTPGGVYYLTELIKTPNPNGDYGPYAYGLSGYSDTLTTFNGGPGQLGLHGTNDPAGIGTQVSHGCIRMNNADITRLAGELPLGTPIQIDA